LAEDGFLGREVEIDAALAGVGRRRDLVDRGVAIAAPGEGMERRVEDLLTPRPAAFRLGRTPALARTHRFSNKPTDQSVCHGTASPYRATFASRAVPGLRGSPHRWKQEKRLELDRRVGTTWRRLGLARAREWESKRPAAV